MFIATNRLLVILLGPCLFFSIYVLLVFSPVSLYTEAECLREGYPEYRVSVGLERYCMNLDGSVTVRVDKQ